MLERARADVRISGAAVTGSAAAGREDRWSDIDLFFGVNPTSAVAEVLEDWSSFLYGRLGATHHFDLRAGDARHRAFPLHDLLEIDLGFTTAAAFGPIGDGEFGVVFGEAMGASPVNPIDVDHLAGLAWHHVLHSRVAIERGAWWQAEHWVSAVRNHVLTLACLRLGLPTSYAKGADRLPAAVTDAAENSFVASLAGEELSRALRAVTRALIAELQASSPELAEVLRPALTELAELRADRPSDSA